MLMDCHEHISLENVDLKVGSQMVRLTKKAEPNRSAIFCCSTIPRSECHEFCVQWFIGDQKCVFTRRSCVVRYR
jgi:hypothetical protein